MIASALQENPFLVTAVVIFCSVLVFFMWCRSGGRTELRLPPGPPGWPIVRNLPVLFQHPGSTNEEFYYSRMAKKYGEIYKLDLGPQMQYVLTNIDHIKEAFSHSKIQGRPPAVVYPMVFGPDAGGLGFTSGPEWRAMKLHTTNVFRELGVGRGMFEKTIQSETKRFAENLDTLVGSPCPDIFKQFTKAVCNIVCGILFGRQFDYDEEEFKKVIALMKSFSKAAGPSFVVMTNGFLCGLPFGPGKALREVLSQFRAFLRDQIEISRQKPGNNFAKAFLLKMENCESYFNEGNLITSSFEMFFAGTDTVSSTLSYAILSLASNPEVQIKCQQELDDFTKIHGMPSYSDHPKLPFTQAVIHETDRMANVVPLGVPHVVEEDLQLFGYDFPKGTLVASDVGSLCMDVEQFLEPRKFNPERFIEDGEFNAHPSIIPFSVGRRTCPGEPLAKMELFLFLTSLLSQYTFSVPEGTRMPDATEGVFGGNKTPPPFSVVINRREN